MPARKPMTVLVSDAARGVVLDLSVKHGVSTSAVIRAMMAQALDKPGTLDNRIAAARDA